MYLLFFFKQKTAYEMRISDWSSDVCSSDLFVPRHNFVNSETPHPSGPRGTPLQASQPLGECSSRSSAISLPQKIHHISERTNSCSMYQSRGSRCKIGRASCRERVCQYV